MTPKEKQKVGRLVAFVALVNSGNTEYDRLQELSGALLEEWKEGEFYETV